MKKEQDIKRRRARWLAEIKCVAEGAFFIQAELGGRLCPLSGTRIQKHRNHALRQIARLSKGVSENIKRMSELEDGGGFGFKVGLGINPYGSEMLIICLALLTAARLDANVSHHIHVVGDLGTYVARRNPARALSVRSYFREDGVLYPSVSLFQASNVDRQVVRIRESAFNRIMGLPCDRTERMCDAKALIGKTHATSPECLQFGDAAD